MSSKRPAPTKRERARNEQALKELLKVPGNDRCADCNAMNPGWASWSVSSTSIDLDRSRWGLYALEKDWWVGTELQTLMRAMLQIGVFLCTRCASIHRKLGTHVSKVKSLSLDNWESDQVDVWLRPS